MSDCGEPVNRDDGPWLRNIIEHGLSACSLCKLGVKEFETDRKCPWIGGGRLFPSFMHPSTAKRMDDIDERGLSGDLLFVPPSCSGHDALGHGRLRCSRRHALAVWILAPDLLPFNLKDTFPLPILSMPQHPPSPLDFHPTTISDHPDAFVFPSGRPTWALA